LYAYNMPCSILVIETDPRQKKRGKEKKKDWEKENGGEKGERKKKGGKYSSSQTAI